MKIIRYQEHMKPVVYQNVEEAVIRNSSRNGIRGFREQDVKAGILNAIETGEVFPPKTGLTWDIVD